MCVYIYVLYMQVCVCETFHISLKAKVCHNFNFILFHKLWFRSLNSKQEIANFNLMAF